MESVIDTIKHRLPITDVLASYITLIPSGTQYKARCPFHNERTASFSVSPDRGLYYCFGCGAKGDMFTFVEQFEGLDFKGALKILAERAGVPLIDSYVKSDPTDPLYAILEKATVRYQLLLANNTEALAYLTKRGITKETIETFRIGYVSDEWRCIASSCSVDELPHAERAGLVKKTEKGFYDRFRGRIMFPLMDASGRVIGFSGRLFPEREGEPKYLNSPETDLFQKSRVLFGFDKAKFAIKKHGFAVLVEGQVDVIMSHQMGFKNTVATSGTALSDASVADASSNLTVLSRLTPNLIVAFDGDVAGQKALRRAATVALSLGMNPKVLALSEGVDPAEYLLTHTPDKWKTLLKASNHFILHEVLALSSEKPSAHVLVRMIRERLFPYLAAIPSPIERNIYFEQIARELGIGVKDVSQEFVQFSQTMQPEARIVPIATVQKDLIQPIERFLAVHTAFPTPTTETLSQELAALSFHEDTFGFPKLSEERMQQICALIEREYGVLDMAVRDDIAQELSHTIRQQFFASLQSRYTTTLKTAEQAGDDEAIAHTLARLHELSVVKRQAEVKS